MKLTKHAHVALFAVIAVTACEKSTPPPPPPRSLDRAMSMTITVDGQEVSFEPPAASLTAIRAEPPIATDQYGVAGGQIVDGVFYTLELHVPSVPEVPHVFDVLPESSSASRVGVDYAERLDGATEFIFATNAVTGSVTITELTADRIAGTFHLDVDGDGTGGSASRTLSNGTFDMELEAFYWQEHRPDARK